MEPIKLNLGCGKDIREGYINLDIDPISDKVLKHDVEDLSDFADNSVSEVLAFDIIEHFPQRRINPIIKEWCRVLRPGGKLIIQTPDIEVIFSDYYKQAQTGKITWARFSTILHGKDEPFQTHYVSLSFQWLKEILEQYNMTGVTKEKTAQNMKVTACKNTIADNDSVPASASRKSPKEVKASKLCMLRLRMVRAIRYLCRRHGFIRALRLDTICDLTIKFILMPRVNRPTVVPTNYGFDLIVDPKNDIGLERQIFETGSYQAPAMHVIESSLRKGDTFLDIGSNIGLISLLAAATVGPTGKVCAFEPEPDTFAVLTRNIEINAFDNIQTNNYALGSNQGKENIFRELHNRAAASLVGPRGNTIGGKEVLIKTLDAFVNDNITGLVRMIKINVQGWELEVLKGAKTFLSRPDAPIICIEYCDLYSTHGGLLSDVYKTICDLNDYRIFKLEHGKNRVGKLTEIKGPEHLPAKDKLFCFLDMHLADMDNDIFVNNQPD